VPHEKGEPRFALLALWRLHVPGALDFDRRRAKVAL